MSQGKNINTLVGDIYNLFNNNHTVNKENADKLGKDISDIITNRMGRGNEDKRTLRLSLIGKPLRQVWYELKGYTKLPIPPHAKIKFLYGDILEALLLFLAREAGHKVEEEQKQVKVDDVVGHQDARIDGVLIDVKSASTRSFQKFETGKLLEDDSFGYLEQLAAYMEAKQDKVGGWLAIDKTLGHLTLMLVNSLQLPNPKEKIKSIKEVISKDTPPNRCYEPKVKGVKGNLILGTECSYCPFKFECWKDSNEGKGLRTFLYASGPEYFVKIVDTPSVTELLDTDETQTNTEESKEA